MKTKQGFKDYTNYSRKPRMNQACMDGDHIFSVWSKEDNREDDWREPMRFRVCQVCGKQESTS